MPGVLRVAFLLLAGALLSPHSAVTLAADGVNDIECQSTGVGFTNGGSYLIDVSSQGNFSFASVFSGNCSDYTITPILRDPLGDQYTCTAVKTTPLGIQQISTCDIPYSSMTSGAWEIVIQSPDLSWTLVRMFSLTAGVPSTTTVTTTPTVVIGTTSAPPPTTVFSTVEETHPVTVPASTITSYCRTATRTVTSQLHASTTVVESTVIQYSTVQRVTSEATLVSTLTASCRFQNTAAAAQPDQIPSAIASFICAQGGPPPWIARGKGKGGPPPWITRGGPPPWIRVTGPPPFCSSTTRKQESPRGLETVAAWTTTYTETTYTATTTSISLLPVLTVTQLSINTVTATITPPAQTLCTNAPDVTETITSPGPKLTRVSLVSSTSQVNETVFVTQTHYTISDDMVAATACWQAGGSFGVQS